ncbi:MAG: response regulator [Dyella sp.]|uniref:response regulator n=1 Tax=Dyella sp. TaxID=1869338 RepID=UPI003F8167F4
MNIQVVMADDHPVLLSGMDHMLAGIPDIDVAGLASNSTELVELLERQVSVDVVVTDFSMPHGRHGDGITLLRLLGRRFPKLRRVVLTGVESSWILRSILDVHVSVIVSKTDPHHLLEPAIRAAYAGHAYLSPEVERLVREAQAGGGAPDGAALTKRETEVLRMYAEGLTVSEIGDRVGRSRKTVSTQKLSAMRKLGLQGDAEIFQYAMMHGLVQASQVSRGHVAGTHN